jgi:hypothetical protein
MFLEEEQVVALGPGIYRGFEAKSCSGQFLDGDIFGDTVSTTVGGDTFDWIETGARRKFDDGETTAGL